MPKASPSHPPSSQSPADASILPAGPSGPPPLNAGVRRHLGQTLRRVYATTLTEPLSPRMEALLDRLDTAGR